MSPIGPIQNLAPTLLSSVETDPSRLTQDPSTQILQGLGQAAQASPAQSGAVQPASFSNILESAVNQVDDKMRTAGVDQQKLLTGETSNLHQSVIAMQEASLSFSLMVEVRNKLVDSYQELMKMQV